MPHVFVIPPEEEQQDNPPWCCFDADKQPETTGNFPSNPDIHFFDVPYLSRLFDKDAPAPIRRGTSVDKPTPRVPIPRKLEKKQRPEAIKIIETKPSQTRQKNPRDSDVIEVVKVKRTREAFTGLEENTKAKRSKTLKARASKALRSIKNVGKGSHRTPHVKELWTSSESMPGIFKGVQEQIYSVQDENEQRPPAAPSKQGSLARSNSRSLSQLSQIFQPIKPLRSGSPLAVEPAAEADHVLPTVNPLSLKYNDTNPSFIEIPDTVMLDDALDRPASPNHTMKKKNITPRFSVRELHRLFSFSTPSPNDPGNNDIPSTATSTSGSGCPDTPAEEGAFTDARPFDLGTAGQKLASRFHQALQIHPKKDVPRRRRLSDLSIEMRLDSFHFDELSFDLEDFDVPMEGNVLR